MKEPEHISYFFAHHANGRFTASNTPGLKNSHSIVHMVGMPKAGKAIPLPGAAEPNTPLTEERAGLSECFLTGIPGEIMGEGKGERIVLSFVRYQHHEKKCCSEK